jgi:hypothetical protein
MIFVAGHSPALVGGKESTFPTSTWMTGLDPTNPMSFLWERQTYPTQSGWKQKYCPEIAKYKHDKIACFGTHFNDEGDETPYPPNSFVGIQHGLNGRALKKNFVWKAHNYEKCIRNDFPDEVEARKEMIKQSSNPESNLHLNSDILNPSVYLAPQYLGNSEIGTDRPHPKVWVKGVPGHFLTFNPLEIDTETGEKTFMLSCHEAKKTVTKIREKYLRVPLSDQVKIQEHGGSVNIEDLFSSVRTSNAEALRKAVNFNRALRNREIKIQELMLHAPWDGHTKRSADDTDFKYRSNPEFYFLEFPSMDSPSASKSRDRGMNDEQNRGTFAGHHDLAYTHIGVTRNLRGVVDLDIHAEWVTVQYVMESSSCINSDGTNYERYIKPREIRLRHGHVIGNFWTSEEAYTRQMLIHLHEMTSEYGFRNFGSTVLPHNLNHNRRFRYLGEYYKTMKSPIHPCEWHAIFRL